MVSYNDTKFPFCTLLILDGWGIRDDIKYNAIKQAKTPNIDYLYKHSFNTTLKASGTDVGLPNGIIGNSEVGHLNIGAGKIVKQTVLRIDEDIDNGEFFKNPILLKAIHTAIYNKKSLHLMGLISDGLVHSSLKHLFAILKTISSTELKDVYIHAITDGRDTPIDSSYRFISDIENNIKKYGVGKISTVGGRYFAMDRDNHWERIEKYYDCIVSNNKYPAYYKSAHDGILASHKKNITDEFIEPFRIDLGDKKSLINEGDVVIFFNYREDRAREITKALSLNDFKEFEKKQFPIFFTSMYEYEEGLCSNVIYPKIPIHNNLSKIIADDSFSQFKIAETEKYAHVTYFFNGGREIEYPMEDRVLIPSLRIPTYDLDPRMKVYEITDELIKRIESSQYKIQVANFANADMVGHTGNLEATIKACEYIDECIGKVMEAVFKMNGLLIITADHGNAEIKYLDDLKQISTKHTTNPVPFLATNKDMSTSVEIDSGILADIAPTILKKLGLKKSEDMNGNDLLE